MCGIVGYWDQNQKYDQSAAVLHQMTDMLFSRGPDSGDIWQDKAQGLGFGHRRLAILDLSANGHQPMVSASGRYLMTYNGEIYNAAELKKALALDHIHCEGHSDTRILLEACEHYGIEQTLKKLIGMFVFALWDRENAILYLARDRLGVKPLYWGMDSGFFIFGSQLKALKQHPGFHSTLNISAISSYFRYNYFPGEDCVFEGIQKLKPGHYLKITKQAISNVNYWDWQTVVNNPLFEQSESSLVSELENLLEDAVRQRILADVPLGAFLSGGIDSSLVVSLMQKISARPVKTFTIGFSDPAYNEAPYAKEIAKALGTDHCEMILTPEDAMNLIPGIPEWCDEPFADSSQIPTLLVSQLARKEVIVALSGDGGDEVFAGYHRYLLGSDLWRFLRAIPSPLRYLVSQCLLSVSPDSWDKLQKFIPKASAYPQFGHKIHKLGRLLQSNQREFYQSLVSAWQDPSILTDRKESLLKPLDYGELNFIQTMQYWDSLHYLPNDILTKVDRATMAVGLEARVPLLDHRVVEFAWRLPMHYKIRNGQTKWILREILSHYLPRNLFERPKMGFGIPLDQWLRGPLRPWVEDLLSESSLKKGGLINPAPIRKRWLEHLSGKYNWAASLWSILMFQAWHDTWL